MTTYRPLALIALLTVASMSLALAGPAPAVAATPVTIDQLGLGAPILNLSGSCPGEVTVTVAGATPNSSLAILTSNTQGSFLVPSGACEGTEIDLSPPQLAAVVQTDGAGSFSLTPTFPGAACSTFVQAFDLAACASTATDTALALETCTETMDSSCPDTEPACGATFAGGTGCVIDGLGDCYDTGLVSYRIDPGQVGEIDLEGELIRLDVFFAAAGSGAGELLFFDADGVQVGDAVATNGDCTVSMPPTQALEFSRPVRSVEVRALGSNHVYIDTLSINPD